MLTFGLVIVFILKELIIVISLSLVRVNQKRLKRVENIRKIIEMKFLPFYHLALFIIVSSTCETFVSANNDPVLLVISFDAFKQDYLRENYMIFLKDFYNLGVLATNMNNCFPTKTFTNHFSIATGLYLLLKLFPSNLINN